MTLSLWHLLIPYGAYLTLFAILALVDVYHMVRFGTFGFVNFVALLIFLAGTAVILWWTTTMLTGIHWTQPIGTVTPGVFGGDGLGLSAMGYRLSAHTL